MYTPLVLTSLSPNSANLKRDFFFVSAVDVDVDVAVAVEDVEVDVDAVSSVSVRDLEEGVDG